MTPRARREQILISGPARRLRAVLELLAADPRVEVVTVATTSRSDPGRLVVTMEPEQADALAAALGRVLVVERDELLPDVLPPPPSPRPDPTDDTDDTTDDTTN